VSIDDRGHSLCWTVEKKRRRDKGGMVVKEGWIELPRAWVFSGINKTKGDIMTYEMGISHALRRARKVQLS
jgi:hypothetical protein